MKIITAATIICAGAVLAGCGSRGNSNAMETNNDDQLLTVLVGSYSHPGDTALRAYSFDVAEGDMDFICGIPVSNASYFTQAPSGMIYTVSESDEAGSSVTAIRPTGKFSIPEVVNALPVGSSSPCYITVSPDGRFVVTANYGGGTAAVFPIAEDGSIRPRKELIEFSGRGPVADRQEQSHPHCIAFTPDSKFMLVDDLGTDQIHQFSLKEGGDSLVGAIPDKDVEIIAGSGPRHIVFNKKGNMAYLINEISDSVTVLTYDGQTLEPVQYIAADTVGAHGAGDIHLSPDGKYLYASLRLKNDGVATFSVDQETGLLTHKGHTPTLGHPRNFTISLDGRFMLVASRDGNAVQLFAIDQATGSLTDTGKKIEVDKPVCVKFIDPAAK